MECEVCGRKLKSQASVERGIGPGCWKKIYKHVKRKGGGEGPGIKEEESIPGQMKLQEWIDTINQKTEFESEK